MTLNFLVLLMILLLATMACNEVIEKYWKNCGQCFPMVYVKQKQPSKGVLRKTSSENMQQI